MSCAGTLIADISKHVERVEVGACDPLVFLGRAKMHLANRIMEAGDVQAWWIVNAAQKDCE